jgi:hypothetical protein
MIYNIDKNISYLIKTITIFIIIGSVFFFSIEIIEIISNEECIAFPISKVLIYIFCISLIFVYLRNNNLKYLFVSSLGYLIYTSILFCFHLLLEIHRNSINMDIKLLIVLNMISVFFSIYASVFLFLLNSALVWINKSYIYLFRKERKYQEFDL